MWPKRTEKLWDDNNSSQQEFDCQLIEMKYEFREIEDERKKNKFQRIKCAENTSDITDHTLAMIFSFNYYPKSK